MNPHTISRRALLALPLALRPVSAWAAEILTARGTVTVAQPPKRLAVLDLPSLDTLTALGADVAGVPDNLYVASLKTAHGGKPVIGTLFEPDLEALYRLKPDYVLIGGRSSPSHDAIRPIAPVLDMTLSGDGLVSDALRRIAALGALTGKTVEAEALIQKLSQELEETRNSIRGKGHGLIIMTNGAKLSAYGPSSRNGWIHREAGLPPSHAAIGASTHGEAISFEFIRKVNPDWLIVLDRGAAIGAGTEAAAASLDNALLRDLPVFQNKRVIYMPPAEFYIAAGGATATLTLLETLRSAFTQR